MNRKRLSNQQKKLNRAQRKAAAKNNNHQKSLSRSLRDRMERKLLLIEHLHLERHYADRYRKQRIDALITKLLGEIHKIIKAPKPMLVEKTPVIRKPIQDKQIPALTSINAVTADLDLPW